MAQTGSVVSETCPDCGGAGWIQEQEAGEGQVRCTTCHGFGIVFRFDGKAEEEEEK